jgi:predicted acetyltransferase
VVQEFFVLRAFRRKGIGDRAASEIFNHFPGRWQLQVLEKNLPAQAFWRRVVLEYTGDQFEERSARNEHGYFLVFRFESMAPLN